jgi:hypothetical protein
MQSTYVRVSTYYQTPGLHLEAFTKAGRDRSFRDTLSGATAVRPELLTGRRAIHARLGYDAGAGWPDPSPS